MLDRMTMGDVPRKHHIALRSPTGALRYEECITREGFDGPYTIAYHLRRPHTARETPDVFGFPIAEAVSTTTLKRRHYFGGRVERGDVVLASRRPILVNRDVVISIAKPEKSDTHYFSNGDADDLFFVQEGGGTLKTIFGDVRFTKNDYVFVPKGTIHRFEIDEGPQFWLGIECFGGMGLLKQWRNATGQLRMDAPYCHRDFGRPTFNGPVDEGIRNLIVKREGRFYGFVYDESPLDLVGWDGSVFPWTFPIMNFQARVGLVHVPPTWHGTFAARGALICSFVPRPVDFHEEAIPCPYPHASVDVDEFLFYCQGNFTSRRGVGPGSMSFHPAGIPHGPHPGSYERSIGTTRTDELAVMLDCFEPLKPTRFAVDIEDEAYHESFR